MSAPSPSSAPHGLTALATAHGLSAFADGVYLVALPWLALQTTGSAAALGTVLAVTALPRAAFLVVGGAWADRFSSRAILVSSSLASASITAALAAGSASSALPAWGLYAAAAALGVVDAVAFPAASALVPRLVAPDRLHRANALMGVLTQAATFAGPAAAAALLALGGTGLGLAASAGLSLLATIAVRFVPAHVRARATNSELRPDRAAQSAISSVREGFAFVRTRPALLGVVGLLAGLNLALVGPVIVGGALLAEVRFGGPGAFGAIVSAWGAGGLAGAVGASLRAPRRPVGALLAAGVAMGGGVGAFALPVPLAALLAVSATVGAVSGWLEVHAATWIQAQTPDQMQGRVMGLVALAAVGMEPVSHALAGLVSGVGATVLFAGAAGAALLTVVGAAAVAKSAKPYRDYS